MVMAVVVLLLLLLLLVMVARIVRMQMVMVVMVATACCCRSSRRQGAQVGHRRHATGERRIDQKRGIRSRHMITRDCRRAGSGKTAEMEKTLIH